MRAVLCRTLDGPEGLTVEEVDPPSPTSGPSLGPSPGHVRIRVRAAGVNFADSLITRGRYQEKPELPFTPGFEVAGEVIATAPDDPAAKAAGLAPGARVMALLDHGGYAQEALARVSDVTPIPQAMDFVTAAAMPVAYLTSLFGLTDRCRLAPGETLLVHGAAGGVGLTAVECGKALGARVIATAGGADKLATALDHGADHGIDYKTEDVRERVKALTDGRGADVVYDPVGGDIFKASLRCTAPEGRILCIGFASGEVPQIPANYILVKNITVIGYMLGAYRRLRPDDLGRAARVMLDWWNEGRLRPHVGATYPLDQAHQAIQALLSRKVTGKVVITVD